MFGTEFGGVRSVGLRQGGSGTGCHPFVALLPLTDGELILAKARMAARSTLETWALVLVPPALWLAATGRWRVVADAPVLEPFSGPEACGLLAAVVAGLVLLTWLRLVGGLWVGLTGREWLTASLGLTFGAGWMPLAFGAFWLWQLPTWRAALVAAAPAAAVAAVALKSVVAWCLLRALSRRGYVGPQEIALSAFAWATVAGGLFAILDRLVPPDWAPRYALGLGVALVVPLNRLLAAPLVLARSRHQ
jgi:hypothetical protein